MVKISELEEVYREKHRRSLELYQEALRCFPSGITHDGRHQSPFTIYAKSAEGTRKWDVDGNEYIDYVMGHGSLLFGYNDKEIMERFQEETAKGFHIGASTELEITWANHIKNLVPSARTGLVRATACGSEAVQMGIRLARIYTGKDKIVVHLGAYHGKQSSTIYARRGPPAGIYNVRGIPEGIRRDVVIVPFNNLEKVEEAFRSGDVACLVHHCNALYSREYLKGLRELTNKYGVVLLFDEVVSGFRYSAGGAQEYYGVTPDLTALGKIIGGGAPVGAICGSEEIMELYSFKDEYWNKFVRISVGGTWNAQPICIAGGVAMLEKINKNRDVIYPKLYSDGKRLADSFNDAAEDLGLAAYAYGLPVDNPTTISLNLFREEVKDEHVYLWETGLTKFEDYKTKESYSASRAAGYATYLSMINNGVFSYSGRGGSLCTKYSDEDLQKTEEAFNLTLEILKENNLLGVLS